MSDYLKQGYSVPFAQLILIDGADHIPHDHHADVAWEFFRHFRRDAAGRIVELAG